MMEQATTRELAYRANDGVEVRLHWNPENDRFTVVVEDTKADERFELEARHDNALEVFYHPFAYAPAWASTGAAFVA
jgi:hypothetical protein